METSTPESRSTQGSNPVVFSISEDAASDFFLHHDISSSNAGFQRGISPMSHVSTGRQAVAADFIRAETIRDNYEAPRHFKSTHDVAWWTVYHLRVIFKSKHFNHFMAFVVMIDAFCNCIDIDARAADRQSPQILLIVSYGCLVMYTVELLLSFSTLGVRKALRENMIKLDLFLFVCGYIELVFDLTMSGSGAFEQISLLRMLRLMRVFRLLKIFRKVKALKELNKLVKMMSTCMKTLLWSFCFCFMVILVWAMLIVEVVHPLLKEMDGADLEISNCVDCLRSTSSVMDASLLLFKTVIAGDAWGEVAVPVIRSYPYTAVIFMGAFLTIVFGVLNLIVAVVVDTFADARERDVLNLAEEMESDLQKDRKHLQAIFNTIDLDGSGELTFDQLLKGARKNPEFQSRLRVMDIDEGDLKELFYMIDLDGSGTIELDEFIRPLSRWVHDSKTAPRFIKYNMMRAINQQEELKQMVEITFMNLASKLDQLSKDVSTVLHEGLTPTSASRAGEEVEQPHPSLPVTLKEVVAKKSASSEALESAVQELRRAVTAATDLALQNSMVTLDRLFRDPGPPMGVNADDQPPSPPPMGVNADDKPPSPASALLPAFEPNAEEAVAKIPPSCLAPRENILSFGDGGNENSGHGFGLHLPLSHREEPPGGKGS